VLIPAIAAAIIMPAAARGELSADVIMPAMQAVWSFGVFVGLGCLHLLRAYLRRHPKNA
jgi:hypothetical protein